MNNSPNVQSIPQGIPNPKPKRSLVRLAVLLNALLLSGASALAYTNYLGNAGGETGTFSPWRDTYTSHSIGNTNNLVYTSTTVHEPARTGQYSLKSWGTFWGSGFRQEHTVYQDFPAAVDSVWSGDIWATTMAPDNIKGGNFAQLIVSFFDASTNLLGINYSSVLDTNSPTSTWIHLVATNTTDGSTNLTAPWGTAYVRFGLLFSQDEVPSGGSTYFDDATLIKTAASDPEIAASPKSQKVIYGQTATFTVLANGTAPLTYQWQKDWVNVSGGTNATLVLTNITDNDAGAYFAYVTNGKGASLLSDIAYLTVQDPGILTNPASLVKTESETATFTVVAPGSGTLSYAWYKDGTNLLSNGARISGANTATLTIANLTAADSGSYSVTVSGATQVTSSPANLYVKALAQASNLLLDGGFEWGLTYWNNWNGRGIVTAPPGLGETNHSGSQCCELWGTGNGTWNGVNQSFRPIPGAVYAASAWALQSTGALIAGSSEAWLEVNFYNKGNTIVSYASPHITSNSVAGVWTNLVVVNVTPPANADEVRCQLNYHAGNGGGAIFLDDVSFWVRIPVPTVGSTDAAGNCHLSFPAQPGVSYEVLYKDDLSDSSWQVLRTVTADLSGQVNLTESAAGAKRFYRINALWNK